MAAAAPSAPVPDTAALLHSQGKSDVAITSALRQEGYTPAQIAQILQEMTARVDKTIKSMCRKHRRRSGKVCTCFFSSCFAGVPQSISTAFALVDIPTDWTKNKKVRCSKIKKSADAKHQRIFGGVPSGTRTHGLQIHNLAR